ncbi:hypothetical protein [Paenibacillus periandrae]|uniref:hypothetical protein n=1 Tax=Paenibacillus periandrae TaxID=1761741 RepID=UPI001F0947C5|nr:hypothetical protein [Paenibacillus periandrae]
MKQFYSYPIHPLAKKVMKITDNNAILNPFFNRQEESLVSLLLYYLEGLFQIFPDEHIAYKVLRENPHIFQFSLDVFQQAFHELPENSLAKQVFKNTPFAQLTPNWEESDRKIFIHTLFGLRRRFQIRDESTQRQLGLE